MLEDKLLIWKFKKGSDQALCRIYRKYADHLLSLAVVLLKDVNAAEDVLHDVFCKFIESKEKLKLAGSLKSYLATCVVNLSKDRLRARRSQAGQLDETAIAAPEILSPEYRAVFGEQAESLNTALSQLDIDQRQIIMLHLQGGMKFRQIAELQQISINTVKSRYRYGLEKLRAFVSDEEMKNEND